MSECAIPQTTASPAAACDNWIRQRIAGFDRWFAHVDFGNGIVARSTAWPDAPLNSPHMGVSKFEYIVRRNLPDLRGKRVLELGCNAGAVAVHMARLGAAEVVGIDSEAHWPTWRAQAALVQEAAEWRDGRHYHLHYLDADIAALPELDLGRFDVVIALNCLYYLEPADIDRVIAHAATIAPRLLVQCNTRDHDGYLGRRGHPAAMSAAMQRGGFTQINVDWPWDKPRWGLVPRRYHRPVVTGQQG